MTQEEKPKKENKLVRNLILGAVILAGLGILAIIGVIALGIISAIAVPSFINAKEKASIKVVEMRVEDAVGVTATAMSNNDTMDAAVNAINTLSINGTPDKREDDPQNPCDNTLPAYDLGSGACVVSIDPANETTIIITGYDSDGNEIISKTLTTNK